MERGKQIYKLPEGWILEDLGNIAFINMGQSPPSSSYNYDRIGLPFYQGKSEFGDIYPIVEKYCSEPIKIVDSDDVLISVRAPIGPTNLVKDKSCIGRGLAGIKAFGGMSGKFLLYQLRVKVEELQEKGTGTTFKSISKSILEHSIFKIPPLNEQERIVSKIESLFSELDQAEKGLQKAKMQLKILRLTLLKSAFEGKLTEQWRKENNSESIEKLQNSIYKMRKQQFEDELALWKLEIDNWNKNGKKDKKPIKPKEPYSAPFISNKELKDLADIPNKWKWVKTSQIISIINNGYTPKSEFLGEGQGEIPFIKVYNLTFNGVLDFTINPTFIPKENHQLELKRSICQPGDVLINIVGPPLGKVSIVPETYREWNINQAIVLFRPNEYVLSKYISFYMQNSSTIQWLTDTAIGTAGQRNVKVSTCREIPIPLCPVEEQEKIIGILETKLSLKENLEKTIDSCIQTSNSLRQSILKNAFAGKLVPQDSLDKPASELLKQIKAEKETFLNKQIVSKQNAPKKIKKMSKALGIEEVLKNSTEPMSAKEVWQKSKHKDNIEDFYAELKELGDKVNEVKKGLESLLSLKQ
ncbi:type I restriction enzyme S subunit [Breznakibacter xylanolyticus]|uniref:Type I restriction enzyme S subunit n=1 Tax=Breznakibacter xylanolyticus TaxID=990 RepID=A0A2W7NKK2_9BACT|nr:restriction endonuclease subunit S [Breznakibacter xylanolyticus]PZX19993.1 type I restriction enzyme S subunit [Breznakibacter xylanolyticus]